jgi:hypothetical protein
MNIYPAGAHYVNVQPWKKTDMWERSAESLVLVLVAQTDQADHFVAAQPRQGTNRGLLPL